MGHDVANYLQAHLLESILNKVFRNTRSRRKAQDHWDKLRKYVMYTWAPKSLLKDNYNYSNDGCCSCGMGASRRKGESLHKRARQEISLSTISFDKKDCSHKGMAVKHVTKPVRSLKDDNIPATPSLPEFNGNSAVDVADIKKNLQDFICEYNTMLREKLDYTQSMLHASTTKYPSATSEDQTWHLISHLTKVKIVSNSLVA